MGTQLYPIDLSDEEWTLLAPLLPAANPGGRPRSVNVRTVLNGLWNLVRSGCACVCGAICRMTTGLGPRSINYFRCRRNDGRWEQLHARLRELARQRAGRDPTPSAAIIDSQSVKTHQGGPVSVLTSDGQGTVAESFDSAGTVTSAQLYTPYGVSPPKPAPYTDDTERQRATEGGYGSARNPRPATCAERG